MATTKYAPPVRKVPSFMLTAAARLNGGSLTARARDAATGVPREFLVRDLKEKRKFRLLSRKLTVFVTFVTVYLAVLLLDRNISGRSAVRRIISTELIATTRAASGMTFGAINSVGAFWDWFANSFLISVYTTTSSDGLERTTDELYTIASHTTIVGGFHIRQTRYASVNTSTAAASDNPCSSYLAPTVNQTCFSSASESTDAFGVTNGSAASATELQALTMFRYSTNNDSVGGFQTYFLRSSTGGAAELATVTRMRAHRWIDRQTKSVEITMPLYNSNLKLWSIVDLKVAYDLAGGVAPTSFIHVTNLEPYNLSRTRNVVRVALEVVYVLHIVYFVLLEFWDVCVLSNGSVRTYVMKYGLVNNLGDWANIAVNIAIIIWRYFCQSNATRFNMLAIASFDEYVSALSLAEWDDILLVLNVCNMLLLTGRSLKYFQVTNGGRRLMSSVYGAMPEVLSFLPIYFSVLIGYSFVGHMLYGLSFPEWSTYPRAFFRVFEINFGLYDPGPIYDGSGYLSVVFIYTSNIVFCILMLNVFMAIVMSTWDNLADREAERATERAQFARTLSLVDLALLVSMSEDVVDLLIDVAVGLEQLETITKQHFTDAWMATGVEVSAWTWSNICSWYWDEKSPDLLAAVGLPDVSEKFRAMSTVLSMAAPPPPPPPSSPSSTQTAAAASKPESTSDDLVVITSARALESPSASVANAIAKSATTTTTSKPHSGKASAKVFAAAPASDSGKSSDASIPERGRRTG